MGLQSIVVGMISIHNDWVSCLCPGGGGGGGGGGLEYSQRAISRVFFGFESQMSMSLEYWSQML